MKQNPNRVRAAAAGLLVSAAVASILWAPRADAGCATPTDPNVLECVPPDADARDKPAGPIHTVLLSPLVDLPEGLNFFNVGGLLDLTLESSGAVTSAPVTTIDDSIVQVFNVDGLNTVTFQQGFALDGSDAGISRTNGTNNWTGIANVSLGNSGVATESLTDFAGTLLLDKPLDDDIQGIVTFVAANGSERARTVLRGDSSVIVVGRGDGPGDGIRGVAALGFSLNAGLNAVLELEETSSVDVTGAGAIGGAAATLHDSLIQSAGDVTVTGAGGVQALAALYATTELEGTATVRVGGGVLRVLQGAPNDTGASFGVYAGRETSIPGPVTAGASIEFLAGTLDGQGNGFTGLFAGATVDRDAVIDIGAPALITVAGDGAGAVHADSDSGLAAIDIAGTISSSGTQQAAVRASTVTGAIAIDTQAGSISTTGEGAAAIAASATTSSADLRVRYGALQTTGADARGVDVVVAPSNSTVFVETQTGTIATSGANATGVNVDLPVGFLSARIGGITTLGADAPGFHARVGVGAIDYQSVGGSITTSGARSHGVWFEVADADSTLVLGPASTSGAQANAVFLDSGRANLTVLANGALSATGSESAGLWAYTDSAVFAGADRSNIALDVQANVTASGRDSVAVMGRSVHTAVGIDIGAGATLLGGWSPAGAAASTVTLGNGVGLAFGSAVDFTATINNAGSIGALSDRAVAAFANSGAITLTNTGTITGTLSLGDAADVLVNQGTIELRDFADENGDGTRDVERVATLDLRAGDDVLRNEGGAMLRLGRAPAGSTVVDRQYLPDLMAVESYALTTTGVEQGHLVQLERFEHRGSISLRDADVGGPPTAGDVLLMTSGTINAQGVLTPGAAPMVFLSDGGSLFLDTELNQGGAQSHSDMLVVDSVQLGINGATRVFIENAGGLGAATTGAGIKLVDVLGGDALSAPAAFVLGSPVVAGAFTYNLFRSAPLSTDGDWYLRTAPPVNPPVPPVVPPPDPPPPPPPPPDPPPPTYRPEAALFASLPAFLRDVDAAAPGSRAARLGDEAGGLTVARRGRAWARYVGEDIDSSQAGTVAPSVSGDATGWQLGVELFGGQDEAAAQIGLYAGRLEGSALVSGSSNGVAGAPVGILEPTVTYAGLYVSRSRGRGFYFDTVLQYGFYGGEALTYADGVVASIKGTGGYASLEAGYGFAMAPRVVVEPQFQIVAQPQRVHRISILNADVSQDPANTVAGRVGLRVKADLGQGTWRFRPYASASLWQGLDHRDRTRFSGNGITQTTLVSQSELKAIEISGGLSVGMGSRLMGFADYSRLSSRGGAGIERDGTSISAGLRFAW